jgi:hypothetical protein
MKYVRDIVGTVAVAAAFWALMMYGQSELLADKVVPVAGTKLPEWLENFQRLSTGGISGSLASGLAWYALGERGLKFNSWNKNFRPIWIGLLLVPVVLSGINWWFTKPANEGSNWAHVFYFLNNCLTFYLGTVLFSPPSVMYTPPGAEYVRRW